MEGAFRTCQYSSRRGRGGVGWLIDKQFSQVPLYTLFLTTNSPTTSPLIHRKEKSIEDSFKGRLTLCFLFCPPVLNKNKCYIMGEQSDL